MASGRNFLRRGKRDRQLIVAGVLMVFLLGITALGGMFVYTLCRIEVPTLHMAILVRKTGKDLPNGEELAPSEEYKGVQKVLLGEGRHFRNPWHWRWMIVPQVEIPQGKLGVLIRMHGEEPPYGQLIAQNENQKGILPGVLMPGRYALNAWIKGTPRDRPGSYAEYIELHEPVTIPAGFKGVVTNLSGPLPENPNVLLVPEGYRGVQGKTLDEGTYYLNPYMYDVKLIDCRSQRYNLSAGGQMGFPSRDGFWITLDGVIEFRVEPEDAAQVFVMFNDTTNDEGQDARVAEEIINKVIFPNARAFCRLRGAEYSGREFISGEKRTEFQNSFQRALEETCSRQSIDIIQVAITDIIPPAKIAEPVRQRQIAIEEQKNFLKQIERQESEKKYAVDREMIVRGQTMVEAERDVVRLVTEAQQQQEVALIEAQQRLKVAELELQAAADLAAAAIAKGRAAAEVIQFENEALAAGWKRAVAAFSGNGDAYARWAMFQRLAPAFRQMMINTADSPIMEIFKQYNAASNGAPPADSPAGPVAEGSSSPATDAASASSDPPVAETAEAGRSETVRP